MTAKKKKTLLISAIVLVVLALAVAIPLGIHQYIEAEHQRLLHAEWVAETQVTRAVYKNCKNQMGDGDTMKLSDNSRKLTIGIKTGDFKECVIDESNMSYRAQEDMAFAILNAGTDPVYTDDWAGVTAKISYDPDTGTHKIIMRGR